MPSSRITLSSLALVATSLLAYTAQPASADGVSVTQVGGIQPIDSPGCFDSIQSSPVVMMTTAGGTLAGPQMSSLVVYSSGVVIMSEASGHSGASAAGQTFVDPVHIQDLRNELRGLGSFQLCDEQQTVSDIPLTTVTVFSGEQSARAHSYSYWIGTGEHQDVQDAIQSFIIQYVYKD